MISSSSHLIAKPCSPKAKGLWINWVSNVLPPSSSCTELFHSKMSLNPSAALFCPYVHSHPFLVPHCTQYKTNQAWSWENLETLWVLTAEGSTLLLMLLTRLKGHDYVHVVQCIPSSFWEGRLLPSKILLFCTWMVQLTHVYRYKDADFTINLWSPIFLHELKYSNAKC